MSIYDLLPASPGRIEPLLGRIEPLNDPLLRATFGPLRLLALGPPRDYYAGRTPDNDFIVTGKSAHLASRKHCKLTWDGDQMTIMDLQSSNGTWVNGSRLADGEVRTLRDQDRVAFTPAACGGRVDVKPDVPFWSGPNYALRCVYDEYKLEGDCEATLSPAGRVVRRSLAELHRIRHSIRNIPSPRRVRTSGHTTESSEEGKTALSYRGSLDRPDRPQTPFYIPPLPIDLTPELRRDKRFRLANFVKPGPEDPDGVLADHPSIIWHDGVRYKHVPGIRSPPWEILHWSNYHNLPVGLHIDWPLFSSVTYGARPPAEASLPPHTRREDVYATFRWPPDNFINERSDYKYTISRDFRALAELQALSPAVSAEIMRRALPNSGLGFASSVSASHSSGSSGPVVNAGLKHPRTPDNDAAERPAKRVALAASLPAERATTSAPTPRSPSPSTLSSMDPSNPSPTRNMVSQPIHDPAPSLASTRERIPEVLNDVSSVPHASIGVLNVGPTSRKRKRQDEAEAEVADVAATELEGHPRTREAATSAGSSSPTAHTSDALRTLPSHVAPKKRRRVAQPAKPIRRSSRVRKKAMTIVQTD
ncbi:hypothetical protein PENSPDRAFT_721187 [Peniophora sp. CONT]|nr:hypothetical protein PENSPDRAFT_721187 [Peniophora sp. CONT]